MANDLPADRADNRHPLRFGSSFPGHLTESSAEQELDFKRSHPARLQRIARTDGVTLVSQWRQAATDKA
jgi:hypothetical protein